MPTPIPGIPPSRRKRAAGRDIDPTTQLEQQLQDLQSAIASGVQEVRFQDRTVRYASIKDMIDASNYLYQLLYGSGSNGSSGTVSGMKRQVRAFTNKGL